MNNIKLNILIATVTFILCVIITITSGINFFWLAVPIIFIVGIAFLSSAMKQRFGRTYGIAGYLIILFVIPILWYFFSASMPIRTKTLESQQKAEDLSSFQKYAGGVDAKTQVAQYQMKQDSLLKEQVSALLKEGLVDSALALIKKNDNSSERIKKELFSSITNSNQTQSQGDFNHYGVNPESCGEYPEASERYLTSVDVSNKPKEQLRIMRNEIFMRHGYIFNSPDLAKRFSAYKCYTAKNVDITHLLSQVEKANVELIKRYESITGEADNNNISDGKLAVINDPDGYSNVRSAQGKEYNILGIIRTGEQFYARADNSNDWWQVKTQSGLIGYVHKSRIQFIQ